MDRRDFLMTAGTLVASEAISQSALADSLSTENTTLNGGLARTGRAVAKALKGKRA